MARRVWLPLAAICASALHMSAAFCAESTPAITFHASFDKGLNADKAGGDPTGEFKAKDTAPRLDEGIRGRALRIEKCGEVVSYQAKGNIPEREWTITFWVKGLGESDWNLSATDSTEFVEIFGRKGWTRYYKYIQRSSIFLLTQHREPSGKRTHQELYLPKHEVPVWHMHAIVWKRGQGAKLFLDGRKVAEDASHEVAEPFTFFRVGQSFGSNDQPRLIDEFTVYAQALAANALRRLWLTEGEFHTPQRMRLAQTQRPAQIDGEIEAQEWAPAAVVAGLIDEASAQPAEPESRVFLMYGPSHLYVAFHCPIPEEDRRLPEQRLLKGFLKSECTQHDGDMAEDDYVGVQLMPRPADGERYVFMANGIDTRRECRVQADGTRNLKWNPDWSVKSKVSMDGWDVEMAIPLAAIADKGVEPGDVCAVNFVRQWSRLKRGRDVWCWGNRDQRTMDVEPGSDLGQIEFAGPAGAIVQMQTIGAAREGRLALDAKLIALGRAATGRASVSALGATLAEQTFSLQPGQTQRWRASADLAQTDAAAVQLAVADADGKTIYYRQHVPFHVAQSLDIACQHYPSRKLMRVAWQMRSIGRAANALAATVTVRDRDTGRRMLQTRIDPLSTTDGAAEIDVKSLPKGHYRVEVEVSAGKDIVAHRSVELEIAAMPTWCGNSIGLSDRVPPPWTPIDLSGDTVKVWARQIAYSGRILPEQITTKREPILARPMTLLVTKQGAPVSAADRRAEVEWVSRDATQATCRRSLTLGDLRLTTVARTEFDGFTWVELTVAPKRETASLDALALVVPIRKAFARLINPHDYVMKKTGALPADGFTSALTPLWLGNHTGGIQFVAETDATWRVKDVLREMRVEPKADSVELRVVFVDHTVQLKEPLHIEFGYVATPVKPAPRRYRHWRVFNPRGRWKDDTIEQTGPYVAYASEVARGEADVEIMAIWCTGWGAARAPSGEVFYPIPRPEVRHMTRRLSTGPAAWFFPYYQLHSFWAESAEFKQFGDEWKANLNAPYIPAPGKPATQQTMTVCQNCRSYRDFVLFGLNKTLEQTHARGFYFDVSKPIPCNNLYHGCGQPRPDGPAQPTLSILGTRKLLRRIYTLVKQKHKEGLIFFHMSGQVVMPVYSFCDAMVDGENFTGKLDRKDNRGYERILGLDAFAAQYNTQNNFGPASVFLPEFDRSGSIRAEEWAEVGTRPADYIFGLVLLHDSQLWWAYIHRPQLMKLYAVLDSVDWGYRYEFIPYWSQHIAKLPEGVVATWYRDRLGARALAVVMNFNEARTEVDTRVDLAGLGLPAAAVAADLLHGEKPRLERARLRLGIPAKTFRLLLVQ